MHKPGGGGKETRKPKAAASSSSSSSSSSSGGCGGAVLGGGGGGGGWSLNTNDFPSFRFQKMEGRREEGPFFVRRQWGRDVFEFPPNSFEGKETEVPFIFSL